MRPLWPAIRHRVRQRRHPIRTSTVGRQQDGNGCAQRYVAIDRVEAAIAEHWATYLLTEERRAAVRAGVLAIFQAQAKGAQDEIATRQARVIKAAASAAEGQGGLLQRRHGNW